ncbi:MAG: coenzyme F420-0:L-glutamate ligase [Solirubrobacteraceae bacterium]|nr:coenzyme F420-0:L-glutamate ligase [Patulibacter sp.]
MTTLTITPVEGLPEIAPGDDLAQLIARCAADAIVPGAVVCVVQKLVSKAEGRLLDLADVDVSETVALLAASVDRDPRLVQVILDESAEIIRAERGVLICRTHHGYVCANAGIDQSNAGADDRLVLLPLDPDASARGLRADLERITGVAPLAVIVSDSFGRAWRTGQVDVALGVAGLDPSVPPEGLADRDGRPLAASEPAIADELAGAADLVRTKSGGQGVVVISGYGDHVTGRDGPGVGPLLRSRAEDLFGAREAEPPPA